MAAIITVEEYKLYAGINSPNQDAKIESLIAPASQTVISYLGYSVTTDTGVPGDPVTTRLLASEHQSDYLLPPFTEEVFDVHYSIRGGDPIEIGEGSYFFDSGTAILTLFNTISNNTILSVSHSPSHNLAEDDIKLATTMLVDYWMDKKNFQTAIVNQGQSVKGIAIYNLPQHIEAILSPHRLL